MTPSELIDSLPPSVRHDLDPVLKFLSRHVSEARLVTGQPLSDRADFRDWLEALAFEIERRRG